MKYVAAYHLLVLGGNKNPSVDDMTKFFRVAGVSADAERIRILVDLLKGRNFEDVQAAGNEKINAMMEAKAEEQKKLAPPAPAPEPATSDFYEGDICFCCQFIQDDDDY